VPDQEPREAEAVLAGLPWRRVTWRRGSKGPLAARFAATRIRAGDGATWANNRHLPGEEVWLVGEWRASGERKYHLSSLPPRTSLRALACRHQGALGLRAGAPAAEAGTRLGPLRGPVLDRACTGTR
jgi:hypothetical protein